MRFIKLLLGVLLLPVFALAQNQGDDMGLGAGGTKILAYTNAAGANLSSGDGKANYLTTDRPGNLRVYLSSLLSGEDTTNNVIGTVRKYPIVSTYAPSLSTSFGTATTANAKATAGILKGFSVSNINAAIRYFQIFNTTGATTPVLLSIPISAGSATLATTINIGEDVLGANGLYLSTGITWGISTTKDSYVAATAADHNVNLVYY